MKTTESRLVPSMKIVYYSLEHIYFTNLVHKKKERGKDYVKQL